MRKDRGSQVDTDMLEGLFLGFVDHHRKHKLNGELTPIKFYGKVKASEGRRKSDVRNESRFTGMVSSD